MFSKEIISIIHKQQIVAMSLLNSCVFGLFVYVCSESYLSMGHIFVQYYPYGDMFSL